MTPPNKPSTLTCIARGLQRKCPRCGEGDVLSGYVAMVRACAVCGESFAHISADDAPPWLTIVVVGHIMISLIMTLEINFDIPVMIEASAMVLLAVVLTGLLMPVSKGVVIGLLWAVTDKDAVG
jgi:uncharacterized protein (DUF983 family)